MEQQVQELDNAIKTYIETKKPIEEERRRVRGEYETIKTQVHELNVSGA
jgi:predicted nuclease with TOPRIM domain